MIAGLKISGFADEISADFDDQLKTVTALGMNHICLRAADGKGIAQFSLADAEAQLLSRLDGSSVRVSSLGSPIGKIDVFDDEGFARQLVQLETLCQMCSLFGCEFIRVFSFYVPAGQADSLSSSLSSTVIERVRQFVDIAQRHQVTLIHENEKGIFGDTAARCRLLFDEVSSPHFKAAFDFANFVQCGEDPLACWRILRPDVAYFHIKDALSETEHNVLCGQGDGKIAEILELAVRDGYRGFLTLEPHLAKFATFAALEQSGDRIPGEVYDGPSAFAAQYNALTGILQTIEGSV